MTALDRAVELLEQAKVAVLDARIELAQQRDGMMTQDEFIVYLDGLSEWEATHGEN